MPGVTRPGYAGQLFVGTAGSPAQTQVLNCEDLSYSNPVEKIETTTRGNGAAPPRKSEVVVSIGAEITWSMLQKDGDAVLVTLLAAARAGAPIAVRTKSYAAGTGFDGDVTLQVTNEKTLKGQNRHNFTATPCDDLRDWQPNV